MTIPTATGERGTRTDSQVTASIIDAVSTEAGIEPAALPPLFERIDPDALDALFAPTMTGPSRSGTIEFQYCGYEITVHCDDDVSITLEESPSI